MKIQIDNEVRDATNEEIAAILSIQNVSQQLKAQAEISRNAAEAKLSALGLTGDDLKALGL
jgi:hypothetical protein